MTKVGEDDEVNYDTVWVDSVVRMKDGNHYSIRNEQYINSRLNGLMRLVNDAETYQAAHRLRLIHKHKPDQKKKLYILSNRVLNITVDKLVSKKDVEMKISPSSIKKIRSIASAIKREGGIKMDQKSLASASGLTVDQIKTLSRSLKTVGTSINNELVQQQISVIDKHYVYIPDTSPDLV